MQVRQSKQRDQYRPILRQHLDDLPQFHHLSPDERIAMMAVSAVLPFRTNAYVIEELIDWDNIPDDPIYQLTFPQKGMLTEEDFDWMVDLINRDAANSELNEAANDIRLRLNPHPAGQIEHNVPHYGGEPVSGMQHKYWDTALFFPSQGQTCHAFCTYCFRWAQFVGIEDLKFSGHEADRLHSYLKKHKEVHELLFTGGDPMVMKTEILERYINGILSAELPQLKTIRIGTKSLSFWPYMYISDPDSWDLLNLLRRVNEKGIHLALMAHINHPRELETDAVKEAIARIRETGTTIRSQSPILRHINDDPALWISMWKKQVNLGIIPYYMFV
ncbi:MAG: lysine 2,3-aminomutase, partial [Bacteroidales bacterium]|nr:lysine 2,3-aminomutase [Bacteroidales bacterium]